MPELKVAIGGHEFHVHCQPGEEPTLLAAAKLLDAEAATVIARNGRMPDVRLLLLAGLLLADRTAAAEDQLRAVRARAEAVEKRLADQGRDGAADAEMLVTLRRLAERAEALALRLDSGNGG